MFIYNCCVSTFSCFPKRWQFNQCGVYYINYSKAKSFFDAQLQQTTSTVCSIYNNKAKVLHVSLFCYFFIYFVVIAK